MVIDTDLQPLPELPQRVERVSSNQLAPAKIFSGQLGFNQRHLIYNPIDRDWDVDIPLKDRFTANINIQRRPDSEYENNSTAAAIMLPESAGFVYVVAEGVRNKNANHTNQEMQNLTESAVNGLENNLKANLTQSFRGRETNRANPKMTQPVFVNGVYGNIDKSINDLLVRVHQNLQGTQFGRLCVIAFTPNEEDGRYLDLNTWFVGDGDKIGSLKLNTRSKTDVYKPKGNGYLGMDPNQIRIDRVGIARVNQNMDSVVFENAHEGRRHKDAIKLEIKAFME